MSYPVATCRACAAPVDIVYDPAEGEPDVTCHEHQEEDVSHAATPVRKLAAENAALRVEAARYREALEAIRHTSIQVCSPLEPCRHDGKCDEVGALVLIALRALAPTGAADVVRCLACDAWVESARAIWVERAERTPGYWLCESCEAGDE